MSASKMIFINPNLKNLIKSRNLKDAIFIFMGVSLLIEIFTHFELSSLIVLFNLPFIILWARQIFFQFAIKSSIAIFILAVLVHILVLPDITDDKLLISIFGGFFLGAGISLTMRGGAIIDGTEVLAITISRKSSLTIGDFIAVFNIILFCVVTRLEITKLLFEIEKIDDCAFIVQHSIKDTKGGMIKKRPLH